MLILLFATLLILAATTYWLSHRNSSLAFVVGFVMLLILGLLLLARRRYESVEGKRPVPTKETAEFEDPDLEYDVDVPVIDNPNITIQRNVKYGDDPKQVLDICKPKTLTSKAPLVILIHGGGGDKSNYSGACQRLAASGYIAASVNYREEPAPAYPMFLEDIRDALVFLRKRDDVDVTKTAAMGGSGGGYASSMLGTQESPQKVKCVVNQFGPTDYTDPNLQELSIWNDRLFPIIFAVTFEENPSIYKEASVVTHVSANDADFLFTRSTNDHLIPRSQAERLIQALRNVGKNVDDVYEFNGTGGGHATKLPPKEAEKLWNLHKNFLDTCLGVK